MNNSKRPAPDYDSFSQTVTVPSNISIEELARTLYKSAFKDGITQMHLIREWGYATSECRWLRDQVRDGEVRIAEGESLGSFGMIERRKQLQAALYTLDVTFARACDQYFGKQDYANRTWPGKLMAQDAAAATKDWYFFFSVKKGQNGISSQNSTTGYGIDWHLAVAPDASEVEFEAPRNALNRPGGYKGAPAGLADWAKMNQVLFLCVKAPAVQAAVDEYNSFS